MVMAGDIRILTIMGINLVMQWAMDLAMVICMDTQMEMEMELDMDTITTTT